MERHYTEILIDGTTVDGVSHRVYTAICGTCGWTSPYAFPTKSGADDDADEHVRIMSA